MSLEVIHTCSLFMIHITKH